MTDLQMKRAAPDEKGGPARTTTKTDGPTKERSEPPKERSRQ
jgi:hypothetical protein